MHDELVKDETLDPHYKEMLKVNNLPLTPSEFYDSQMHTVVCRCA